MEYTWNRPPFFLFGMGDREKYYYRSGGLYAYPSGKCAVSFDVAEEEIIPDRYTVKLVLSDGERVTLCEDSRHFAMYRGEDVTVFCESELSLPDFEEYDEAALLRVLHHEILINIYDGRPLPNFFVYRTPWYRDSAMMTMVLEKTGNLRLVRDWVLGIDRIFDGNNKGNEEPDNMGQLLFMISRVSDRDHPMVEKIAAEVKRRYVGGVLQGTVDYGNHPVYAAKWLKFGLESLGLDSGWVEIPAVPDDYSQLFWMDYRDSHVEVPHREYDGFYPYLWWAEQHFFGNDVKVGGRLSYPLTNETRASEADYEGIRCLYPEYADEKNASPHTWHAAEMFLYFTDKQKAAVSRCAIRRLFP